MSGFAAENWYACCTNTGADCTSVGIRSSGIIVRWSADLPEQAGKSEATSKASAKNLAYLKNMGI
jgi:hypothetical protein